MKLIHVPRPAKSASDPERPANALLLSQIRHLQHAERRLPLRYRSQIYTHAIRTEGEAAAYIREVTEAIHRAHDDAAKQRAKRMVKKKGLEIAAAAERPRKKRTMSKTTGKAKKKK